MNNEFNQWLEILSEEKQIDPEATSFDFTDSDNTFHLMPLGVVLQYIQNSDPDIQKEIESIVVQIYFYNGNILKFFEDLGKFIVQILNSTLE